MTKSTFYILHLEDDPGDVSYIPRSIRQRLIAFSRGSDVAIKEEENEQEFVISWNGKDASFDIRYLIAEKVEEFDDLYEKHQDTTTIFLLDILIEPVAGQGLEVFKKIIEKGVSHERILIFTAYPQSVRQQLGQSNGKYQMMLKDPNRDELLRVVFDMMRKFWPLFGQLGLGVGEQAE